MDVSQASFAVVKSNENDYELIPELFAKKFAEISATLRNYKARIVMKKEFLDIHRKALRKKSKEKKGEAS